MAVGQVGGKGGERGVDDRLISRGGEGDGGVRCLSACQRTRKKNLPEGAGPREGRGEKERAADSSEECEIALAMEGIAAEKKPRSAPVQRKKGEKKKGKRGAGSCDTHVEEKQKSRGSGACAGRKAVPRQGRRGKRRIASP